jgi:signal transduction histidine kinase
MSNTSRNFKWHHICSYSINVRLVVVFLVLAAIVVKTFVISLQSVVPFSWRETASPIIKDYVNYLAAEVTPNETQAPSVERAQAIAQRLPLTISIRGPKVNWESHPGQTRPDWLMGLPKGEVGVQDDHNLGQLLGRTTADGHTVEFGIDDAAFMPRTHVKGYAMAALLLTTVLAFAYIRHILRPLADIRAGAMRFGSGNFDRPIAVAHPHRPDELGDLAATINAMGSDIHQMLEAKRALLLAISHELRSPITRARLNTELLPETPDVQASREALLRDLSLMRDLVRDLLESERLAGPHAALHREPVDLSALVHEVVAELRIAFATPASSHVPDICIMLPASLPRLSLDPMRMRLLLRNLLDNALRHTEGAGKLTDVVIQMQDDTLHMRVRDYGPGVAEDQIANLGQPFYRPDAARTRGNGGVGLGLYLCRLVVQVHGGTFAVRNAQPGLEFRLVLPAHMPAIDLGQ